MLVLLFGRIMFVDGVYNLYVVIKTMNSIKPLRQALKKEQNALAREVKMLKPILVGEYDLNRHEVYKHCKNDTILSKDLDNKMFLHWAYKSDKCSIDTFYSYLLDIKLRIQLILKKEK